VCRLGTYLPSTAQVAPPSLIFFAICCLPCWRWALSWIAYLCSSPTYPHHVLAFSADGRAWRENGVPAYNALVRSHPFLRSSFAACGFAMYSPAGRNAGHFKRLNTSLNRPDRRMRCCARRTRFASCYLSRTAHAAYRDCAATPAGVSTRAKRRAAATFHLF